MTWAQSADRRLWMAGAPDGELLTVTSLSRTSWVPTVLGADGTTIWRGTSCRTRLQAQRNAEGHVRASEPEGGDQPVR
jgi:hypothetical protein